MIKSISSLKVNGKRVIVRAGFDVPLKKNIHTENWEVADDARIKDLLPTLKYLIFGSAKIIIISHLGRPAGKDLNESMWPVAEKLAELLNYKAVKIEGKLPNYDTPHVNFLTGDITKKDYSKLSKSLPERQILFLENLRFYPQEEENDAKFTKLLASFGDIYVNDAFSVAHRKESSTYGLAQALPAYGGLSLIKEINSLNRLLKNPERPMLLILGGAKIDDKVEALDNLMPMVDYVILGGAIANTFFKALGYEIGQSKFSNVSVAKQLLRNYRKKIILPIDCVVINDQGSKPRRARLDEIRKNESILDIGPESIRKFSEIIKQAKTLVWNGPFGLIEDPKFIFGSKSLAQMFAARSKGQPTAWSAVEKLLKSSIRPKSPSLLTTFLWEAGPCLNI